MSPDRFSSNRFNAASRPESATPRVIQRNWGESWRMSPTALMSCAFWAAIDFANNALTSRTGINPGLAEPQQR
jgi:hypothetical protein